MKREKIIVVILLCVMCAQAYGQESEPVPKKVYEYAREELIYPFNRPVFGGSTQESHPDEKIIVYVYEFDLNGDGKDDLFISSNALQNGTLGLHGFFGFSKTTACTDGRVNLSASTHGVSL